MSHNTGMFQRPTCVKRCFVDNGCIYWFDSKSRQPISIVSDINKVFNNGRSHFSETRCVRRKFVWAMCVGWGSMAKQLFSPESPTPARLTRMCQTHLCQTRFCDLLSPQTSLDTHWWICCILIPTVISNQDLCIVKEIIDILFSQFFKDIEKCISVLKKNLSWQIRHPCGLALQPRALESLPTLVTSTTITTITHISHLLLKPTTPCISIAVTPVLLT